MLRETEHLEGPAEFLGAEVGVQGEEDLDHFDRSVSAFGDCTHCVGYRGVIRFRGFLKG